MQPSFYHPKCGTAQKTSDTAAARPRTISQLFTGDSIRVKYHRSKQVESAHQKSTTKFAKRIPRGNNPTARPFAR
jgi:hypothetical protein